MYNVLVVVTVVIIRRDRMASVTYQNVTKDFGEVIAVNELSIHVEDKEFLVLVGPSGCGKTTALRLLAGLEELTDGTISIGDRVVNEVAPKDRDIAMVFQSYALYPHMSVYDNMAFGLKLRKVPKPEIKQRVTDAAEILGIEMLLKRKPKQLSGGQRQRVAVGRAIVRDPAVFLFDEPLSNLDAKFSVQTRAEISNLHHRLESTFIYVTHDQVEAMTMATRIAVMSDGILQQIDSPQVLYDNPANIFVAGFIGSPAMNFSSAKIAKMNGDIIVDTGDVAVTLPANKKDVYAEHIGKEVVLGIRPEDLHDPNFIPPGVDQQSLIEAKVDVMEMMGNEVFVYLKVGDRSMIARVDPRTDYKVGDTIQISGNTDNLHLFDKDTEIAIR